MVVLDASAALSWLFVDERDREAEAMLETIVADAVIVPALWRLDLYNGLLSAERRGRVTGEEITRILEEMRALKIEVDPALDLAASTELTLARTYSLTIHDAAYLELAVRRGLKLMTRDDKLADAAKQMGLLWTL